VSYSRTEELKILLKILGRLPRSEFSSFDRPLDLILDAVSPPDHFFSPEVTVTDRGVSVPVGDALVVKIKNLSGHPVFFNLDRDVSSAEYGIVPPQSFVVVNRRARAVYLRAPEGQVAVVKVDALRGGGVA